MPIYYILRDYSNKPDPWLADFGLHVSVELADNSHFPSQPVTTAELATAAMDFSKDIAAKMSGGKEATAIKNAARTLLIALLNKLADYVEMMADNDEVVLLSSGYEVGNSMHPRQLPVGPTSILSTTPLGNGIMDFKFAPAENSWAIEVQYNSGNGAWAHGETFTKPSDSQLPGLTPGTLYDFRARAFGSSNQRSPWSDVVSHMAT